MMGRFLNYLKQLNPINGRYIKEDGSVVNLADLASGEGIFSRTLWAGNYRPVVDAHTRIHGGLVFVAGVVVAEVSNNATLDVVVTSGEGDFAHVAARPALDGSFDYQIFEDVQFTDGTELTTYNLKRSSSRVWGGAVIHAPTVSDTGTALPPAHVPGGTGPMAGGAMGSDVFAEEVIILPQTSYLFRMTNRSGQTRRGCMTVFIYPSVEIPDA